MAREERSDEGGRAGRQGIRAGFGRLRRATRNMLQRLRPDRNARTDASRIGSPIQATSSNSFEPEPRPDTGRPASNGHETVAADSHAEARSLTDDAVSMAGGGREPNRMSAADPGKSHSELDPGSSARSSKAIPSKPRFSTGSVASTEFAPPSHPYEAFSQTITHRLSSEPPTPGLGPPPRYEPPPSYRDIFESGPGGHTLDGSRGDTTTIGSGDTARDGERRTGATSDVGRDNGAGASGPSARDQLRSLAVAVAVVLVGEDDTSRARLPTCVPWTGVSSD